MGGYDSGIGEEGGWIALDVSESHQHTVAIDLLKQHSAPEGSRGPGSSDNWRNDSFSHAWKDPIDMITPKRRSESQTFRWSPVLVGVACYSK